MAVERASVVVRVLCRNLRKKLIRTPSPRKLKMQFQVPKSNIDPIVKATTMTTKGMTVSHTNFFTSSSIHYLPIGTL